MKTTTLDLRKSLLRLHRLEKSRGADRALTALETMQKTWPDHPVLLIERARLIQLSEHGNLGDARRSLRSATRVAGDSPEPWIELGYYLLRIDDHASDAEAAFDEAITRATAALADAVAGKIHVLLEQEVERNSMPSTRRAEFEELLQFARTLDQRLAGESSARSELRQALAELEEKMSAKGRFHRNGK